jgi:hypothetical protein
MERLEELRRAEKRLSTAELENRTAIQQGINTLMDEVAEIAREIQARKAGHVAKR